MRSALLFFDYISENREKQKIMSRKKFAHLLEKYQRGECSPREKKFVEYWFGLVETKPEQDENEVDWRELEEKIWGQMHTRMQTSDTGRRGRVMPFGNRSMKWAGIATSLVLISWFLTSDRFGMNSWLPGHRTGTEHWVEYKNTSSKSEKVALEDGSTVVLWPGAVLQYPRHFSENKRPVHLTGKAFFDIEKNPAKPFFIYSGEIITKVLGTSFYVEAPETSQNPKVEVVTGTVAVYEKPKAGKQQVDNIILKPNQQAVFLAGQHKFEAGLVAVPRLIGMQGADSISRFKFYNTPLSKVVENLRLSYGIDIVLENNKISTCPLTANLAGQPLYTQLDIICAALKTKYKITGTSIRISGKGCSINSI